MDIHQYAEQFTSPLPALHQEVLNYTINHHPHAHMVSGHVQGQWLRLMSHLLQPRRILEVGTFTGFSALCLAEGLPPGGLLYTLELRDEDADTAQRYFDRSPKAAQLKLLRGNALQLIPNLHETWDLVFIDADKPGYIDYYELILPHLSPRGLLIADNVLFHGEVLEPEVKGKNAKAIAAFNAHVRADTRVESLLLTIRDGLMVVRKK
jgi:predicted O-methyltransferase YrrM